MMEFVPEHLVGAIDRTHVVRRKAILDAHPEIRKLFVHDNVTALITAGLVVSQCLIAAGMGKLGSSYWWLSIVLAYCFGAFANHTLFVTIHESIHNAVFGDPTLNKLNAILADLPNCIPTAMAFRCYHLRHHSHLNSYLHDADVPSDWEARLVRNIWWRKALWLFLFPIIETTRTPRLRGTFPIWGSWTFTNAAAVAVFDLLVVSFLGYNALLYLFASFWFSVSLHPLGARWLQEHFVVWPGQTTFSYYGPLNMIALNVGYHSEHHDFHEVPWSLLPKVKALAPEFYDNLKFHCSWSKLLFNFIFDPRYSLLMRANRPNI